MKGSHFQAPLHVLYKNNEYQMGYIIRIISSMVIW